MPERSIAMMPAMEPSRARPRRPIVRAIVTWSIVALAVAASAFSLTTWAGNPLDVVTSVTTPLAFGGVGAFLTVRVPGNPLGPLLLAATAGFAMLIASGAYLVAFVELPTSDPAAILAGLLGNLTFIPSLVLVIVGVPLLFPDGRFLSPRWRWVAVLSAVLVLIAELRVLVGQPELASDPGLRNPFYIEGLDPLFNLSNTVETLAALSLFALAISSLVLRYRRTDDIGRHQIRWLAAVSAVAVVAFGCAFFAPPDVAPLFGGFGVLALNAIPLAIGIAVVRYRLYDIDRLISRGISYGLVTRRPACDVRRRRAHPAGSARHDVRNPDRDRRHLDARHRGALPARSLAHPPRGRSSVRPGARRHRAHGDSVLGPAA